MGGNCPGATGCVVTLTLLGGTVLAAVKLVTSVAATTSSKAPPTRRESVRFPVRRCAGRRRDLKTLPLRPWRRPGG